MTIRMDEHKTISEKQKYIKQNCLKRWPNPVFDIRLRRIDINREMIEWTCGEAVAGFLDYFLLFYKALWYQYTNIFPSPQKNPVP